MAATIPVLPDNSRATHTERAGVIADEWPIYAVLAASASIVIGLIWDISWHRTIGRDTFWSPPHVIEQIGAIVSGLSCGYVVLKTTFAGSADERARSVRFWKYFQAPLGAWICIWGTIMMVTSAPFDNWWHNAYGLDVKIISPPHLVLASGMIAIQLGAMYMALGAQNRAKSETDRKRLAIVFALSASAFEHERAEILAAGCDDFVTKPYREGTIFDKLSEHLGLAFAHPPLRRLGVSRLRLGDRRPAAPLQLRAPDAGRHGLLPGFGQRDQLHGFGCPKTADDPAAVDGFYA